MRRLTLLLVSLVLLSIQSVLAQSFSVKGTVVSAEDNEPMIGVTIMQEGTSNGVVTDIDGNYTIEIKGASKATLVYSYVGCVTQKHVVKAQTNTLNITRDRVLVCRSSLLRVNLARRLPSRSVVPTLSTPASRHSLSSTACQSQVLISIP